VILDSSVLVEANRGRAGVAPLLRQWAAQVGNVELALCSVTVAELAHGIHRADTPERRSRRRVFLDDLKAAVVVHPITVDTAELVGRINAECSRHGDVVPLDDLLIGCCALELGYAVATRNDRHFRKIPGLELIQL